MDKVKKLQNKKKMVGEIVKKVKKKGMSDVSLKGD